MFLDETETGLARMTAFGAGIAAADALACLEALPSGR